MMDISKLSVLLSAGLGGFAAGMKQGERSIESLGSAAKAATTAMASFGAALGIASVVNKFATFTSETFSAIDANAKLSDTLGVSTESLGKLQYAASYTGVSNDQLTTGLERMLKTIGETNAGMGQAKAIFDRLGVSAADLAKMPADKAFGRLSDAITAIHNPAERANAIMEVFGRGGAALYPLMLEGSQGLNKAGNEAAAFGYALSRVDAAKVEAANDAMTKVGNVIQGVVNQAVIKLAPYIEAAAQKMADLASRGNWMGRAIVGAIEAVTKGIAYAADWVYLLEAGFYGFRAGALEAMASVLDGLDALGQGIVNVINKLPGMHAEWNFTLAAIRDGLHAVAADEAGKFDQAWKNFTEGKNAAAVGAFFDDINRRAQLSAEQTAQVKNRVDNLALSFEASSKKIEDAIAKAQKELRQFDYTKGQKAAEDLAAEGATQAQQNQIQGIYDQIDAMEEAKKTAEEWAKESQRIWEDTRTPLEKYTAQMAKLDDFFRAGFIDAQTFNRAASKADRELFDKTIGAIQKVEIPQLLEAGSQDAARFVTEIQAREQAQNAQRDMLLQQAKGNEWLSRIAENTGKLVSGIMDIREVSIN